MITSCNSIEIALLIVTVSLVCVLYFYYFYFFTSIKKQDTSKLSLLGKPVSILIAARNEKENLIKNLPSILSQNYPTFEVIVINDGSFDGTKEYLNQLKETFHNLKVVTIDLDEQYQRGKKFALTLGIKAAQYDYLLFTDADCEATSNSWISTMSSSFASKDVILGYSPLRTKNNLLGALVKYETFHTALQYLSFAKKGLPYMGVGRNLAYTKQLFFDNKGFASHQHILSGDDDLFVQEVCTKHNTEICVVSESFTLSDGPASFAAWSKQKTRHLSTSKMYKNKYKLLLGLYAFAQVFFYITLIVFAILSPQNWTITLSLLTSKWLIQWLVFYRPATVLREKNIKHYLFFYDAIYTIYLLYIGIVGPFLKPKSWN